MCFIAYLALFLFYPVNYFIAYPALFLSYFFPPQPYFFPVSFLPSPISFLFLSYFFPAQPYFFSISFLPSPISFLVLSSCSNIATKSTYQFSKCGVQPFASYRTRWKMGGKTLQVQVVTHFLCFFFNIYFVLL